MFADDFGNTFLDRLQEITLPEPVAWTPQTAGWYVLAALAALGLLWLARRLVRRRAVNRYRRAALAELGSVRTPADIAELLKRTALAAFPRADVAGLTGEAWLGFLDHSSGSSDFTAGPGRILADAPYRRAAKLPDEERRQLLTASRRWIRKHRRNEGVA